MRARAFKVYDRVRWHTLYHEEQGRFLREVAPQVEMWMLEEPKETSQDAASGIRIDRWGGKRSAT